MLTPDRPRILRLDATPDPDGRVAGVARTPPSPGTTGPNWSRDAAITITWDAAVPLRYARILARHADPRRTEHNALACSSVDQRRALAAASVAGV